MSILEGLYRYARGDRAHARENFTTQALAGCIRLDPVPFAKALQEVGDLGISEDATIDPLAVSTQWPVPAVGAIDLVVRGQDRSRPFERWGELKVDAGESGDQIQRYQKHLLRLPDLNRPTLFTLGRSPLRGHPDVPHLTWNEVARAASASPSAHWRDFVEYLKENRLAGADYEAARPTELASMLEFDGLVGKLARILEIVFDESHVLHDLRLPTGSIRRELMNRFASHGDLVVAIRPMNARTSQIVAGVVPNETGVRLAIYLESWPSQSDLQRKIQVAADAKGLTTGQWSKREAQWGGIRAETAWLEAQEPSRVAKWFIDRFDELSEARILDLVRSWKPLTKDDLAEVHEKSNADLI
jgi:hypothetical protein